MSWRQVNYKNNFKKYTYEIKFIKKTYFFESGNEVFI